MRQDILLEFLDTEGIDDAYEKCSDKDVFCAGCHAPITSRLDIVDGAIVQSLNGQYNMFVPLCHACLVDELEFFFLIIDALENGGVYTKVGDIKEVPEEMLPKSSDTIH